MLEITIPLNKLQLWSGNARKTGAAEGLDEMAASIAAHGLLQALVVRKANRGKFAVIAGQRRYLALSRLAEAGQLTSDHGVPCRVLSADSNAAEVSLAENVVRLAMHPADQFEAFRQLIDKGASAVDVAARFGVSEAIVVKRMKLGRVSSSLLDTYRAGGMNLDQLQAFTITDDHDAQERAWSELPPYGRSAIGIRQALTEGEIPSSDKRVRLVTLEAYEAAGGTVRRDLFDGHNGGYIGDTALLDELVQARLAEIASNLTAEGWRWCEIRPGFDWHERKEYTQIHPQAVAVTEDEAVELDSLQEQLEALYDSTDDDEMSEHTGQQIAEAEARIAEITDRMEAFTDEQRTIAGVVISLRHDGSVLIERGLVRREDVPTIERDKPSPADKISKPATLPASLIEVLTQHKTTAIQAELAQQPDIALAAVVHAMTLNAFYPYGADSCLMIRVISPAIGAARDGTAADSLARTREQWGDHLPGKADELWAWCLNQDRDRLLDLLAVVAAPSITAVQRKGEGAAGHLRHAGELANALQVDMAEWFTPTAENYFGKIGKSLILDAIAEARGAPNAIAWPKLKKAELAALAEQYTSGTGWLPEPLRIAATSEATDTVLPPWAD
jgi:ParB family chromosome partitioning protein